MPGLDGIAVAQEIRRNRRFASTGILMLSSEGGSEEAIRARQAGISICLFKPFKQSELLAAILKALGNAERQIQAAPPPLNQVAPPLRILLAEDNRVNQVVATRLLEKRGHTVVTVENGRDAVAAAQAQYFDVALLDVQMPEMDGLQAVALIRRNEESTGCRLPIIALTAHAMRGDRERCLAAGMDGYVSKPISREDLFATIEGVMQRVCSAPPVGHENGMTENAQG